MENAIQSLWRGASQAALRKRLAAPGEKVPLRLETVESVVCDDHIREKVVYDVEEGLAASAWLCRPKTGAKSPALLCCHGHGPGKDPLVGLWRGKECLEYHKLVAVRLARKGFVTLSPDRRGYGDRSQSADGFPSREDLRRLEASRQGTSLLALDVVDSVRAIDLLAGLGMVDASRIGCLGIESGATVAACLGALDERVKALSLTSFLNLAVPGQDGLPSPVELCASFAPRPLLLQIPVADPVAPRAQARKAAAALRKLYRALGATGNCGAFEFDGVLELDYPSLEKWFDMKLRAS